MKLSHKIFLSFLLADSMFGINSAKNTPVSAADAAMKITPAVTSVYIKAGESQNYEFTIKNTGPDAFKFRLYTSPYNVIDEDYNVDFNTETQFSQITRWITFQDDSGSFVSSPTFSLEPGEERVVVYRIKVPSDIPDGGQYCVIHAETVNDSDSLSLETNAIGISSTVRVGMIILGHGPGETKNISEITDFHLTSMFTSHDIEAGAKVKNTGNTDFYAVYSLTIKSLFGNTVYDDSSNYAILPNSERKFTTSWAEAPLFGIFNVKYKVTALEEVREESHLIFIMPTFAIVIVLLLLTLIIITTIILLRKRKERSSRLVV